MKIHKVTLLFIALCFVHLNNAMNDKEPINLKVPEVLTKYGKIIKVDHRDFPPEIRCEFIQYGYVSRIKNVPAITINYDIKKQKYSGAITTVQKKIIEILDPVKIKTIFEQLDNRFSNAVHNFNTVHNNSNKH